MSIGNSGIRGRIIHLKNHPIIIFAPIGVIINILGYIIVTVFHIPLFLDSVGTMLAGAVLGPWIGGGVGFMTNLIIGLIQNPISIPFGIVNAVIGIVVGLLSRKRGFDDALTPLYAALILGLLCAVLGTPIAVYLFGGMTGQTLDAIHAVLIESGRKIFSSAFITRLPANYLDKFISAYLVMLTIRILPEQWKGIAARKKDRHVNDTG